MMEGKSVKVLNNVYEIKYPTVGQFIDMKVQENILSKGQLSDLILIGTKMAEEAQAALAIKSIAFFSTCVPEFMNDLKVRSLRDLSMTDFAEVRNAYVKEILPWMKEWQDKINEVVGNDMIPSDEQF